MLVLTRRVGESLFIGDDIRLTVLNTRNNEVRIGIAAPKAIPVHREEVYMRIKNTAVGELPKVSGSIVNHLNPASLNGQAHSYREDGFGNV